MKMNEQNILCDDSDENQIHKAISATVYQNYINSNQCYQSSKKITNNAEMNSRQPSKLNSIISSIGGENQSFQRSSLMKICVKEENGKSILEEELFVGDSQDLIMCDDGMILQKEFNNGLVMEQSEASPIDTFENEDGINSDDNACLDQKRHDIINYSFQSSKNSFSVVISPQHTKANSDTNLIFQKIPKLEGKEPIIERNHVSCYISNSCIIY